MGKVNAFSENGTIYFHATNIEEFQKLVEDAKKQAQQLDDTIDKLQNFKLNFKFELGNT